MDVHTGKTSTTYTTWWHACLHSPVRSCICMGMCIGQCVRSNCILSLAHVSVQTYALLSGRRLRAASSRRPRLPPTRAATPTLPSRQHPYARSCIRTHDCGLTLALPGCDHVAPTPRVEETRPHSHAHMHLHVCGHLRCDCFDIALSPTAPDRERRRSSRPRRRSRSPSRARPPRGSSRTRRLELARRSACYATPPQMYTRCTP